MSETSTVGNRVRELRLNMGMSQAELARKCGCSQPTLSNIEHGRTKDVQFWVLEGLAKHLGTTAQHLVHGPQQPAIDLWDMEDIDPNSVGAYTEFNSEMAAAVCVEDDYYPIQIKQWTFDGLKTLHFSADRAEKIAEAMLQSVALIRKCGGVAKNEN
jgi:transcriptional regulator with XRE-family HTH domain